MLPMLTRKTDRIPWSGLRTEIDRLFEDFLDGNGERVALPNAFMPTIDMKETDANVVVEVELPGLKSNEIDVYVVEGTLILRGERKQEKEEKTKLWHRSERFWGKFERRLVLPDYVDPEKIDATFKEGVLTLTIARRPDQKPKTIPVKVK